MAKQPIENLLKAVSLHCTTDTRRLPLACIDVIVTDERAQECTIVATDGVTMLEAKNVPWGLLRTAAAQAYGAIMPAEPEAGRLVPEKQRKLARLVKAWYTDDEACGSDCRLGCYPKYQTVIPQAFTNEIAQLPIFGFKTLTTVHATFKALGKNMPCFVPEGWNSEVDATVTKWSYDCFEILLLVMPVRVPNLDRTK